MIKEVLIVSITVLVYSGELKTLLICGVGLTGRGGCRIHEQYKYKKYFKIV